MREGLKYIFTQTQLRYFVAQLMLTIGCVFPLLAAVFRVFVQKKFDLEAHEFGQVFSVAALGSMAGALSFAAIKPAKPIRALWVGIPLVFIMLMIAPFVPTLPLMTACLGLAGFGVYLTFASLTVTMQLEVEERYRGRLSSVIGLGFSSIGPLMCFPWGHLADRIGSPRTILLSGLIFGAGSAYLALAHRERVHLEPSHPEAK